MFRPIILLIALHLNTILLCMEKEFYGNLNLELLKTVPVDILPNITRFAAPAQWWYPHKTYTSKKLVYGIYFDVNNKLIEIIDLHEPRNPPQRKTEFIFFTQDGYISRFGYFDASGKKFITLVSHQHTVAIFDTRTHEHVNSIYHPHFINDFCIDSSQKFLATGSADCKARIFNIETCQEMCAFRYKHYVNSVCFNQSGKLFTTVSDNRTIDIFKQYDDYTLWQIILKDTLFTWLLIKKPNKKINSVKKLLQKVSATSSCSYKELITIWSTFPEYMQNAIWATMHYRIQKYGKTTLKSLLNVF
jgi:WD40 repeat protein